MFERPLIAAFSAFRLRLNCAINVRNLTNMGANHRQDPSTLVHRILSNPVYIFTVSKKVLFEVDQLRECIQDECPEIELKDDSLEGTMERLKEISAGRHALIKDSDSVEVN